LNFKSEKKITVDLKAETDKKSQLPTSAMRQAGNRLRLIDYGCENGFVFKRTFPGKSPARRIAAKRCSQLKQTVLIK